MAENLTTPRRQKPYIDWCPDPEPAAPIDVVIPLGDGSKHDDLELRYCLRAIERYLHHLGRVWIVGRLPAWVDPATVIHLPVVDVCPIKDVAILHKLLAACLDTGPGRPRLSERFVKFSDDQVLLAPMYWHHFGPYHAGDLMHRRDWPSTWWQRMRHTRDWLRERGRPTLHGDTHTPIPMLRDELVRVCRETDWRRPPGLCVGTLYLNWANHAGAGPGVRALSDSPRPLAGEGPGVRAVRALGARKATIEAPMTVAALERRLPGKMFLGYNDAGFTPELRGLLGRIFREKCRFERGFQEAPPTVPVVQHKPAPTLSVIVPTLGRDTLRRTLESIRGQTLIEGDEVILVQDGPEREDVRRVFEESGLPGRYFGLDRRYADFGATPRNRGMAVAKGDYLAFMDDDDVYTQGAFNAIRAQLVRRPGRPTFFRVLALSRETLWRTPGLQRGNISTQIIVVPNLPAKLGVWGNYQGSDFAFAVTTLRKWSAGSEVWASDVIALYPAHGRPVDTVPVVRNLLYHIYPRSANEEWLLNVARLTRSWPLFTGRKVIGIALDAETESPERVRAAFPDDPAIEWIIHDNDPIRGETPTFVEGCRRLESLSGCHATFYAHAKGVSKVFADRSGQLSSVRRWRNVLYRGCLEQPPEDLDFVLRRRAAAGCLQFTPWIRKEPGRPRSWWIFAGTFFWINHAMYFSHPSAMQLGPSRYAVERHLGEMFAPSEVMCFAGHALNTKRLYRMSEDEWDALENEWFSNCVSS